LIVPEKPQSDARKNQARGAGLEVPPSAASRT